MVGKELVFIIIDWHIKVPGHLHSTAEVQVCTLPWHLLGSAVIPVTLKGSRRKIW